MGDRLSIVPNKAISQISSMSFSDRFSKNAIAIQQELMILGMAIASPDSLTTNGKTNGNEKVATL
ncbi:MAG: hypothetical protein MUF49_12045 [Oculatellaceae cyanobacterium Prado106]|nr:hypothetical protein [Oculatellaceae cyanobacterium Prado106]